MLRIYSARLLRSSRLTKGLTHERSHAHECTAACACVRARVYMCACVRVCVCPHMHSVFAHALVSWPVTKLGC